MEAKELLRFMFEAPGDEEQAPDAETTTDEAPAADDTAVDNNPPDMGGDDITGGGDDSPPDMNDDTSLDDFTGDTTDDTTDDSSDGQSEDKAPVKLDEKISAILNLKLYQRFLTLVTDIGSKVGSLKDNSDLLYVISTETPETIKSFKLLDENIRLYLANNFVNERYENNLFFFKKCLNLYNLLNQKFNDNIKKGISSIK